MKKITIIIFFFIAFTALAREYGTIQYGLEANMGYNTYPASFTRLVGIPNCCPTFNDTDGLNYGIGLLYEYYFSNLGIYSNLSFNNYEGKFLEREAELFSVNYEPVWGNFNHHLNFEISSLDLELGVKYQLNRLSLGLGFITSLPFNSNFYQFESISVANKNIFFLDSNGNNTGKNIRNELRGSIPELSNFLFLPTINISYDFPFNTSENIIFRPQISMAYQINNFVEEMSWNKYQIKLSLNLLFNNVEKKVIEDKKEENIVINQDSILAELEKLKSKEHQLLFEKKKKDSIDQLNKDLQRLEMARLDSIQQDNLKKEQELKEERLAFNRMIEEQNKITGKKCDCYYIEFVSTSNKNEFNTIKSSLKNYLEKEIIESQYIEPYQKIKYYRLVSECYDNHLDAFDDRVKVLNKINQQNFLPKIICK